MDDEIGGLVGLVILLAIALAILYVVALIVVAVAGLGLLLTIGIVANVSLRWLLGQIGGDSLEGEFAKAGLVTILAAPWIVLVGLMAVAFSDGSGGWWWWLLLVISTPAYYFANWAEEVPHFHIPLRLESQADNAIRAQEQIIIKEGQNWMREVRLETRLFVLTLRPRLSHWWEGVHERI